MNLSTRNLSLSFCFKIMKIDENKMLQNLFTKKLFRKLTFRFANILKQKLACKNLDSAYKITIFFINNLNHSIFYCFSAVFKQSAL